MVIGICTLAAYCSALYFLLSFTITAILVVTFVLIGSFIPCDLTANVAVLFIISMQLFGVSIFLLMMFMMTELGDGFFCAFAMMVLGIVGMVRNPLIYGIYFNHQLPSLSCTMPN